MHKTHIAPISDETAGILLNWEILWHQVWTKYQLKHKEALSARYTLSLQKNQNCPLAGLRTVESMLVDELTYEFMKAKVVWLNTVIDARRIFVPGGYQELAKIVGAGNGRKAAVQNRDISYYGNLHRNS